MALPMMIAFFLVPVLAFTGYFLFVPKLIIVEKAIFLENVKPMDVFNLMKDVHSYDKIDGKIVETSIVLNNDLDDGTTQIHAHVVKKTDLFGSVKSLAQVTLSPSDLQIRVTSSSTIFNVFTLTSNGTLTFLTASKRKVPGTQFSVQARLQIPFVLAALRASNMVEEWEDFLKNAKEYCLDRLSASRVG